MSKKTVCVSFFLCKFVCVSEKLTLTLKSKRERVKNSAYVWYSLICTAQKKKYEILPFRYKT